MSIRVLALLVAVFSPVAAAHAENIGTFKAGKTCPLYRSKRSSTNPGNLQTAVNKTYPVIEVLPPEGDPKWTRVLVGDDKDARWVDASCGSVDFASVPPESSCHISNGFDSHVFAVSWQAGFCKAHSDKTECKNLKNEPYASTQFTLHGLWPNRNSCGQDYDFCGSVKEEVPDHNFCAFPDAAMDPHVVSLLGTAMPSVKYGTCLDRHEWWKHGTCRDTSADKYFLQSLNLLNQLNASSFVQTFVRSKIGSSTTRKDLNAAFDKAFGQGAFRKIKINCTNGSVLSELQINLPKDLSKNLPDLLMQAAEQGKGSCGDNRITILKP